ncbi:MAG: hypothetical protein QXW41_09395, partial [Fervidicoccaceae archaeon]
EKLGEHGVDSCVSYGELIERVKGTPASEKPTQTTTPQGKERHFIAHAGMLKDVVRVCKHNGELYVKYASVKEVENAYERSKNVFRRRGLRTAWFLISTATNVLTCSLNSLITTLYSPRGIMVLEADI